MPVITIERKKEYCLFFRHWKILLNDNEWGNIGNGELVSIELTEGLHSIQIKKTFASSSRMNFYIEDGNNLHFHVEVSILYKVLLKVFLLLLIVGVTAMIWLRAFYCIYFLVSLCLLFFYLLINTKSKLLTLYQTTLNQNVY